MIEQTPPFVPDEDAGELLAGTPPPPTGQQPPPTPEEMGSSKFPQGAPAPPAPEAEPTEGPPEFTMAEIQAAAEEMKKLPPQVYIKMKRIISRREAETDLGEAGGVAWTTLYSKSGAEFSLTQRDVNAVLAIDGLVTATIHAANKYELSPIKSGSSGGAEQVTTGPAGIETGTGDLNWISVDRNENDPSKLVVKFSVGKFKYPFQEHRGAKQALSLFDSALCEPRVPGGWSEGHFATPGARYEINGTLKVDWEHRGKYYNVLLVHS